MVNNAREKNTLFCVLATILLIAIAFTLLGGFLNHLHLGLPPDTGTIGFFHRILIGFEMVCNIFIQFMKWYSLYCGAACIITFLLVIKYRKCFE